MQDAETKLGLDISFPGWMKKRKEMDAVQYKQAQSIDDKTGALLTESVPPEVRCKVPSIYLVRALVFVYYVR